ncbi:hypothetical protein [Paraburkholderia hospita]|uniref:hypothetical protein n=1 Tax=Paraburkholderia hospita TaxID=169430 RepID=UPI0008A7571A|nr:hypothetical protein [Paraburkholderia hospita]SEI14701.1 hypothetical protein SAMN05192544_102592 [Paraburkholderia hospita]
MSSSFSLLLSARVAVATYHFAGGPLRLYSDALDFARRGGILRARESLDIDAPLLAATGLDLPFDRTLSEVRAEYQHAYRTHIPVVGEYFTLIPEEGWVRIKSLERDGAHGSITVSWRSAPGIFRLLREQPGSYRLRRGLFRIGGSHFVRVDDFNASHVGQLYLGADHPSRGGIYFGIPASEQYHLSALLSLENRVLSLTSGPKPLVEQLELAEW